MGLFSRHKPKIKVQSTKKDGYSGWVKCTHCNDMVHASELQQNLNCCPKCNYHYRLSASQRVELLVDPGTFQEMFNEYKPQDPLEFVDTDAYVKRLENAKKNSGRDEAAMVGPCKIADIPVALAVLDFNPAEPVLMVHSVGGDLSVGEPSADRGFRHVQEFCDIFDLQVHGHLDS